MDINRLLHKIAAKLDRKRDSLFSYSVDKQKKYIEKLGEPKDEIERAYFQYKCQMKFNGPILTFFLNIASCPLALAYLLKYRKKSGDEFKKVDACFFRDGKPENILPNSLRERYADIESDPMESCYLSSEDRAFIRKLMKRYPFSWQFIFKCIIKVGRYSFVIEKYDPQAIVVCAEYSFTSSVLTAYCRKRGVKHIDVMHGEKLYYMRDAFFEFDECYVWDRYYADMLSSMKASDKQFKIEVPPSLRFEDSLGRTSEYDYTYYLADESEETLVKISDALKCLADNGKKISIRPHPRYTDAQLVAKIFDYANIEDCKEITIERSLMRTNAAVSLFSTVLNQASCNGIDIVVDDISNTRRFEKLKELQYVCLNKEHVLLSRIEGIEK